MKKAVLSISGGLDSTSTLLYLVANGYEVHCYNFKYGQRHSVETEKVKENIRYLNTTGIHPVSFQEIDLTDVFSESHSSLVKSSGIEIPEGHYGDENMKSTVVENRNCIFAAILYSKALAWATKTHSSVEICLGIHAGDHTIYPDCRPESREALEHAFRISNWNSELVSYFAPFVDVDKTEVLHQLKENCWKIKVDFNRVVSNTITCYNPNEKGESCGKCGSCTERLEAFSSLGIKDPILYVE